MRCFNNARFLPREMKMYVLLLPYMNLMFFTGWVLALSVHADEALADYHDSNAQGRELANERQQDDGMIDFSKQGTWLPNRIACTEV